MRYGIAFVLAGSLYLVTVSGWIVDLDGKSAASRDDTAPPILFVRATDLLRNPAENPSTDPADDDEDPTTVKPPRSESTMAKAANKESTIAKSAADKPAPDQAGADQARADETVASEQPPSQEDNTHFAARPTEAPTNESSPNEQPVDELLEDLKAVEAAASAPVDPMKDALAPDPAALDQPEVELILASEPAGPGALVPAPPLRKAEPPRAPAPRPTPPPLPDDLAELPDLLIAEDAEDTPWEAIDAAFAIKTVAYSIDGVEPTIFLVWDKDGNVQKVDRLDRAPYSNRCRDRTRVAHYRRRLLQAKQRFAISRPMRIVGLVPNNVDRQFASIQLRAIANAGLDLPTVRSTLARYATDDSGNFTLVVDKVTPFQAANGESS